MNIADYHADNLVSTELLLVSDLKDGVFTYKPELGNEREVSVPMIDTLLDSSLTENIRFSHYVYGPANMIPLQVDAKNKNRILYASVSNDPDPRMALDLIFDLREVQDHDEWAHAKNPMLALLIQHLHQSGLHQEGRAILDRIYDRGDDNQMHYVLFRVWADKDWPCTGHPEMLMFAPLGQHHCPVCGEFVMAGMYHLEEDTHEGIAPKLSPPENM